MISQLIICPVCSNNMRFYNVNPQVFKFQITHALYLYIVGVPVYSWGVCAVTFRWTPAGGWTLSASPQGSAF